MTLSGKKYLAQDGDCGEEDIKEVIKELKKFLFVDRERYKIANILVEKLRKLLTKCLERSFARRRRDDIK